jgi:2-iminobutanoate/2-iminopropanoate deaminase
MKIVDTPHAPAPGGHYVQAMEVGGWLYVSGQLPLRPDGSGLNNATIQDEVRQALTNLRHVIEAASASLENVVKVTLYIADMAHWGEINRIYAEFFGSHRPARSVIPCGLLHYGARIEIDAVACVRPAVD